MVYVLKSKREGFFLKVLSSHEIELNPDIQNSSFYATKEIAEKQRILMKDFTIMEFELQEIKTDTTDYKNVVKFKEVI